MRLATERSPTDAGRGAAAWLAVDGPCGGDGAERGGESEQERDGECMDGFHVELTSWSIESTLWPAR